MIYMYVYMLFFNSLFMFIMSLMLMYLKYNFMIYWNLMMLNSFMMEFILLIDWMSMMFMSLVSLISSFVLMYSVSYMGDDKFIKRFFYLILMFIFSMYLMILSPNIMSILLGWDGLGLVSYALVIYYQNWKSFNSGMVTVLMNRIGDVSILMIISLMMMKGSWNLMLYSIEFKFMIFLLILSACTKSAQIPFSVWLPLAMAAPTPVSSLVHSSTLVTAGVYLMIRFNMFINYSMSSYLLMVSSLTMFMAGFMANFENDLKKIIALSTLSQLGLMMSILSLGEIYMGFFHLFMHALFKSLLFMCSGIVIHLMSNNQDIRYMGMLIKFYPFMSIVFFFASMSLCGLPFLSGFYSKDLIMEYMLMNKINSFSLMVILISTMMTVSYSVRLINMVFLNNLGKFNGLMVLNEDKLMNVSMLMLFIYSVFGGFFFMNFFFYINNVIILKFLEKILVLMICIIGILIGKFNSFKKNYLSLYFIMYLMKMLGLELILKNIYIFMNKYSFYFYKIDKGMIEFIQIYSFQKHNFVYLLNFFIFKYMNLSKILFYLVLLMFVSCMLI